jgi:twitching motility two-component system response regulator PilG
MESGQQRILVNTPEAALKVLLVHRSDALRDSAEIFLQQAGYDVLLAEDGFDALAKVTDSQPQLIFCDILMPQLDGYQTCTIIQRNARFSGVPVILLSGKDGVFDRARGRLAGAQDYLIKPFSKELLLQAVQPFGSVAPGLRTADPEAPLTDLSPLAWVLDALRHRSTAPPRPCTAMCAMPSWPAAPG